MSRVGEVASGMQVPVESRAANPFELGARNFRAESEAGAEPVNQATTILVTTAITVSVTKYVVSVAAGC